MWPRYKLRMAQKKNDHKDKKKKIKIKTDNINGLKMYTIELTMNVKYPIA